MEEEVIINPEEVSAEAAPAMGEEAAMETPVEEAPAAEEGTDEAVAA